MPELCQCCAEQRKNHHLAARKLVEFNVRDLGEPFFKKEDLPLYACIYCDGPVYEQVEDVIFKVKTKK